MRERYRRVGLVLLALCWGLTALAYLEVSDARRWQPDVVGALAGIAAVLVLWLAIQPTSEFAYRVGGTMAVGALAFRLASVVFGLHLVEDADALWISLSSLATTAMLLFLYGLWWLRPVKSWHETEKRKRHVPGREISSC